MQITIRDIAREAGVSCSAVSRALNERPGVGAETVARIRTIAARLGYIADAQAQALVTGKVPFIGLVVPDLLNPFFPAVARGAEEALYEAGYSLLLQDTAWQKERLRHSFELLLSRRVAGLLMAAPLNGTLRDLGLEWDAVRDSVVLVGHPPPRGSGASSVEVDDRLGGSLVGRHLVKAGRRRVAFVSGPKRQRASRMRLAGLESALQGGRAKLVAESYGGWSVESGHEQTAALLARRRRPDGIFAANDLLAMGAARAAAEAGLSVGEDLGIVGYDDIDHVKHMEVPLTTVAQPKVEVGRAAAELLLSAVAGGGARQRVRLEPTLVVRDSCGAGRSRTAGAPRRRRRTERP